MTGRPECAVPPGPSGPILPPGSSVPTSRPLPPTRGLPLTYKENDHGSFHR